MPIGNDSFSHSDTPPGKRHILEIQTDWCYILGSPNTTLVNK